MKNLLKGQIPEDYALDYEKTFSEQSDKIYGKLIPELKKLMSGHFNPSVTQMAEWLRSVHKHRRDRERKRITGQLDMVDRRTHINACLSEVNIVLFILFITFFNCLIIQKYSYIWQKRNRQLKVAIKLCDNNDDSIKEF